MYTTGSARVWTRCCITLRRDLCTLFVDTRIRMLTLLTIWLGCKIGATCTNEALYQCQKTTRGCRNWMHLCKWLHPRFAHHLQATTNRHAYEPLVGPLNKGTRVCVQTKPNPGTYGTSHIRALHRLDLGILSIHEALGSAPSF